MFLMTRNITQCSILFIGRNMRQLTKKNRDGPTGRGIALSMCTLFIDVRRLLVLETVYSISKHFFVLCIQTRPQLAEEILVDEAVVARIVSQIDEDHPICRVHQASGDIAKECIRPVTLLSDLIRRYLPRRK